MKIKDLYRQSFRKFSSHKLSSWILGFFFALFAAAILFIDFAFSGVSFFTIPLIILPFLFATIVNHKRLTIEDRVSLGDTFRYSISYFSRIFRGVFNFFLNLGKLLLFGLAVFVIASSISSLIFSQSSTFQPTIEEITKKMSEGLLSNDLYIEYLFAHNNELLNYLLCCVLPTGFASGLFFFYLISKTSLAVYVKLDSPKLTSQFCHLALKNFVKKNKGEFYKSYFALNFPMFILMMVGMGVGATLSYGMYDHPLAPLSIGLASGLALTALYFPFYLNNMETIYEAHNNEIKVCIEKTIDEIMKRFAALSSMREEDKQKIDDFLKSLNIENNESKDSEENNEDKEQ